MQLSPASRRGFLRGLTTLPLIGGGVTLIGAPMAVAEPCTVPLLERYRDWLGIELGETLIELSGLKYADPVRANLARQHRRDWCADNRTLCRSLDAFDEPPAALPSTRAALVLSTVGCDWREGAR